MIIFHTKEGHDWVNQTLKSGPFEELYRKYVGLVNERHRSVKNTTPTNQRMVDPVVRCLYADKTFPVWVVDDNPDMPILMRMVFNRIAPTVTPTFFPDGDEVLSNLRNTFVLPKLILLDLYMKRTSGFDALRWIRTRPLYQHLPVVVLTSSFSESDQKKALALGADDFLTKPLGFDHTVTMIGHLVEKWR